MRTATESEAADLLHLEVTGMGVHGMRKQLAEAVFRIPVERMRITVPDVGGGFGVKNFVYPEYVVLLWAARRLGKPVRWISERLEDFVTSIHGRDNVTAARLGLDAEGRFLALDVHTIANLGAYVSAGGPGSATNAPGMSMGGGYVIPAIHMEARGVFTNMPPLDAYRGAGKPEANYIIERLIDRAAAAIGIDPVELRRRNLVASFPYRTAMGLTIDCGRFAANLEDAIRAADRDGFAARREASRRSGRLRGLGVCCFIETSRGAPTEQARIAFEADGQVLLTVGTHSNGQGHETSYPQIAGDLLGLPLERFRYRQGDTALLPGGNPMDEFSREVKAPNSSRSPGDQSDSPRMTVRSRRIHARPKKAGRYIDILITSSGSAPARTRMTRSAIRFWRLCPCSSMSSRIVSAPLAVCPIRPPAAASPHPGQRRR